MKWEKNEIRNSRKQERVENLEKQEIIISKKTEKEILKIIN